ncbi:hypothetical protein ED733_002324 [Metarhizium rileyi]|uniref:Uncharacterized protein n=1 Tax=Metarhizium rileyi (strain RCEF 4871) TaxID=1649241 RepID=A0A5C6G3V6_METRR|nr:hypothetical protein ED733_002324 [Metarhizium rileyi]
MASFNETGHCGLQILVRNADVVDKDLARAFARFDLQASVFLGLRPPLLASNSLELVYHSPRKASTHEDGELAGLMNALFSFLRTKADDYRYRVPGSIPLDLLIEAKTIERRLHEFRENHLGKEITSRSTRMPSVTEAHLRVRCLTGTILAATSLHAEEAIYDQFTCDFLGIVDAASEILSQVPMSPVSEGSSPRPSAEISLDVAVIHPLYMTASKCRSSLIRRRAIELLRTAPSLEAAWDARSYANIAERLMQLEEACLEEQQPTDPAVVPEWCRIHSADIYPQNDGKLAKVVFRYRPNGMDGEWTDFSEMIAW